MEEDLEYEVQIPFKLINTEPINTKLIEISDDDKLYLPNYEESERTTSMDLYKIKVYGLKDEGVYLFITRDMFRSIGDKYYCFIYAVKYGKIHRKIGIYETENKSEDIEKLPVGFINFFPFYSLDDNKHYLIELEQDMYSYVIEIINNKNKDEKGKRIGTNILTDIWGSIKPLYGNIKSETDTIKKQYIENLIKSELNKESKVQILKDFLMKIKEKVEETDDYDIIEKYFNMNNYFPFLRVLKKSEDIDIPDYNTEYSEISETKTNIETKKRNENLQEMVDEEEEMNESIVQENTSQEESNNVSSEVNKSANNVNQNVNENEDESKNEDENEDEDEDESKNEDENEDENENEDEDEDENENEE